MKGEVSLQWSQKSATESQQTGNSSIGRERIVRPSYCSQGRGSHNPSTGPSTDRTSFIHGGMEGGYAYIDSSYPRRPGDFARLSSIEFEATGAETLEITY